MTAPAELHSLASALGQGREAELQFIPGSPPTLLLGGRRVVARSGRTLSAERVRALASDLLDRDCRGLEDGDEILFDAWLGGPAPLRGRLLLRDGGPALTLRPFPDDMHAPAIEPAAGNAKAALRLARLWREAQPQRLAPHLYAVELEQRLGRIEQAEGLLRKASRLFPKEAQLPAELARLRLWRGDAEGARQWAETALGVDPGCLDAVRALAGAETLLRRPEKALQRLGGLLARRPDDAEALVWRSEGLRILGRPDEAAAAASAALALRGGSLSAMLNLALALLAKPDGKLIWKQLHMGPLDEARQWGLRTPRPSSAGKARLLLESCLARLGGNRSAAPTIIRDGRLVLCPLPKRTIVRLEALRLQKQVQTHPLSEVLAGFERLRRSAPKSHLPFNYRGEVWLWVGEFEKARADFDQALRLTPGHAFSYLGLAAVEMLTGRPKLALERCDRAVPMSIVPSPSVRAYRGEALRRTGRLKEALEELRAALRMKPSRLAGWLNLALAFASAGDGGARGLWAPLERWCGPLWAEASDGLAAGKKEPALIASRALELMRGNRSSSVASWWDREGRMRFLSFEGAAGAEMEFQAARIGPAGASC